MSACIIPVAPNFQDPPSVPDPGPSLAGFSPAEGTIVTYTTSPTPTFSALVSDPNVNAKLSVRFVWDYPPDNHSTTMILNPPQPDISAGPDGQPINQHQVTQNITCDLVNNANGLHQVELIVADDGFQDSSMSGLTDDNRFDSTKDPTAHIQRGVWTIVMSCMASTAPSPSSP